MLCSTSSQRVCGFAKIGSSLITAGNGLGTFGNSIIPGKFSCVKYLSEIKALLAGDRDGKLSLITIC